MLLRWRWELEGALEPYGRSANADLSTAALLRPRIRRLAKGRFVVKFSEGDGCDLELERGLEPSRPSVRLSTVDTGAAPV